MALSKDESTAGFPSMSHPDYMSDDYKPTAAHQDNVQLPPTMSTRFILSSKSKRQDGDVALKLFGDPDELHEPIDPAEERKLVRKVDFMILPYLAVCYVFFYIDKTTLSYAAIFGIKKDLNLHGTQYNWLSALFYFGFLAWAFPTSMFFRLFIGLPMSLTDVLRLPYATTPHR